MITLQIEQAPQISHQITHNPSPQADEALCNSAILHVTFFREVKHVPSSDANVFPEYILPAVVPLCHDKNEMVRSALARHIAEVSERQHNQCAQ